MTGRRLFAVLALAVAWAAAPAHANRVTLMDIAVSVDPVKNRIDATAEIVLAGGGETAFALAPGLRVSSLRADGADAPFRRTDAGFAVTLPERGRHTLRVAYGGRLDARPLDGDGGMLDDGWYPRPDDAILRHRVAVTTHAPFKGVAPGRLTSEREDGPLYRAAFESEAPGEPPVLFVGPYVVNERRLGDVRLRTYFHRELTPLADGYLDDTARYIQRYAKAIGAYPFSGFSVVSGPHPVGYGFPGLTYMGRRVLKLPFIRKTSLGHEVLHCWWGNGVFIDAGQGNWAEGLTTFMADYAYAEDKGADAARTLRLHWLRDYAALPPERDRPASAFTMKGHDASQVIGYTKVAFFLYMLRNDVGRDAFDAALRRFWTAHRFRAANWTDLRGAFEAEAGRDLSAFFSQWLNRAGAPVLAFADARYDGDALDLTVRQTGTPFSLTLPVRVDTADGSETHAIRIDGAETRVRIPLAGRPVAVTGDPDSVLFRRLAATEAPPILRDVTLADDVRGIVASRHPDTRQAARLLVGRLLEKPAHFVSAGAPPPRGTPFVLVGAMAEVTAYLDGMGLAPPPEMAAKAGTARVWTGRRDGRPYLVVAAETGADLTALLRPLPHYRRSSWLVFDAGRAVERGTWPVRGGPLAVHP